MKNKEKKMVSKETQIEIDQKVNEIVKKYTELLDTEDAASYIGVSSHTLEVWRSTKRYDVPYIKVGRLVKYRVYDLINWLNAHTIKNNQEEQD
jgi:hypothetical protein